MKNNYCRFFQNYKKENVDISISICIEISGLNLTNDIKKLYFFKRTQLFLIF